MPADGETTQLGPDIGVDAWTGDEPAAFLSALGVYESVSDVRFQTASSAGTAGVIWWLTPGLLTAQGHRAAGVRNSGHGLRWPDLAVFRRYTVDL